MAYGLSMPHSSMPALKISAAKGITFSIVRPFRSCEYRLYSPTGHRPAVMKMRLFKPLGKL